MIDLAMVTAIASENFRSDYPTVGGHRDDDDDEILLKMPRKQKMGCWSYDRNLEECQIKGEKQNEQV